jgi:hypothetical protein
MNNGINLVTVYNALFSLLQSVPLPAGIGAAVVPGSSPVSYTWQRTTRNTLDWDKISSADQPLMLLHGGPIIEEQQSVFAASTYTIKAYCWVYFRASSELDPATPTENIVYQIYNAVDSALQGVVPGERQTLGGTIYHAHCEGLMFEPGLEDNQVVMLMPITLRTGV